MGKFDGFAAGLGDAFAQDGGLNYEKGRALGANTEKALADAADARTKAKAQLDLAAQLKLAKVDAARADAASTALMAGGKLGDVGDMLKQEQEYGFRNDAAGVTGLDFTTGNRRAMGLTSGPVDRYQKVGNGVDDRFDEAGVQPLPGGARDGGGSSAAMQLLEANGFLDANGHIREGATPEESLDIKAQAFDLVRSTERNVDIGGVPGTISSNPFRRKPGEAPHAIPATTPQDVAGNAGALAASKDMPAAYQRFRNQSAQADLVIGKIDDAIKDTNWLSAGPLAWASRGVPGTPAFALDQTANTIKANVGFQQLQQMRYESPTGGALGQVAVQELEFLQSALSSLNTAQDPKDVTEALKNVRDHYTRFKEYAAQDFEIAQERSKYGSNPSPAPGTAPGAPKGGVTPRETPTPSVKPPHPSGAPTPGTPITPQSFPSVEAAEAAGLQDGTPIIVNGRKATWRNQ